MSVVERYHQRGCSFLNEPDGRWVKYTDYAELLAERDEIEAMNQQQALRLMEQESARIAAQTKLDAVTKDAERYRWLRGDGPFRFVTDFKPFVGKFTGSGFDGLMRDDADAAIDAAMAALIDQGRAGEGCDDG